MPKFEVYIARTFDEYATVHDVEADDEAAAQTKVEAILAKDDKEHCDFVNGVSWESGGEIRDQRVIDVEESK